MAPIDVLWVIVFTAILACIVTIHYYMMRCVGDKPAGSKTLHDAAFGDTLWFTGFSGTVFCLIDILSRFEMLRSVCHQGSVL